MNNCLECKHYKRSERIGVKCCEFGLHESYCEKDKEDFAIEELEKIKAEIKGNYPLYLYPKPYEQAINDVLAILDKHIKENKE